MRIAIETAAADLSDPSMEEVEAAVTEHSSAFDAAFAKLNVLSDEDLVEAFRGLNYLVFKTVNGRPIASALVRHHPPLVGLAHRIHSIAKVRHRVRIRALCCRLMESVPVTDERPVAYHFQSDTGRSIAAIFLASSLGGPGPAQVVGMDMETGLEADEFATEYVALLSRNDCDGYIPSNMTCYVSDEDEDRWTKLRDQPRPGPDFTFLFRGDVLLVSNQSGSVRTAFLTDSPGWDKLDRKLQ